MFDKLCLIIGDERRDETVTGQGEDVLNPATEEVLGRLPHARSEDLDDAVESAVDGFEVWRRSSLEERRQVLLAAAERVSARIDELSRLTTLEQGKTLAESRSEWDRVAATFAWNGDAALEIRVTNYPSRSAELSQCSWMEPVGVCLAVTAWNFPAILPVRKLAPALAAGCSIVLKASEETPASAQAVVEILLESGLPPGVVNLVFGDPEHVSSRLIPRPEVRMLSFTGSVPVGQLLAGKSAEDLKRCTFELGGHSPVIVFEDADVDAAAVTLAAFKFRNAGQVGIAPSRFYLHEAVYETFKARFVEQVRRIVVGNGLEVGVTMGPLANRRRVNAMARLRANALKGGATIVFEDEAVPETGFFSMPMVLENLDPEAAVLNEEPFGPIVPLMPFQNEEQAVRAANGLHYGLGASVFTASPDRARRVAANLECGAVSINAVSPSQPDAPFGGVKQSGYGYEGGHEGIRSFMIKKLVSVPTGFFGEE
jgi:succinate-semialdehyde dehydrogenase/glutarate-semialdehyde dehydrogenase